MHARFVFLLFCVFAPSMAQSQTESNLDQILDPLFSIYDHPNVPGAAVGVIYRGELIFAKGYGIANLENQIPVTSKTNFRLASLSKAFTAFSIMMLVEQSVLSLDDHLVDLIPSMPANFSTITIRHLLSHTSGLWDYEDLIPPDQERQLFDADVVRLVGQKARLYFTPGSQYRYSNGAYAFLAHIVERASLSPFQDYVFENIFSRFEMNSSTVFVNDYNEVSDRAFGYSPAGSGFRRTDQSLTSAVLGDGGVYSSVEDLFRWDQALYDASPALSQASLHQMFSRQRLNNGHLTDYGFGWVVDRYRNMDRLSHTGSTIGQRSAIQRFPNLSLSVIVLANRENVSPWQTAAQIVDRLLDHEILKP